MVAMKDIVMVEPMAFQSFEQLVELLVVELALLMDDYLDVL